VRLSSAAYGDRRQAERYYEGSAALARFRTELRSALEFIISCPEGSPRARGETRLKTLKGFPYSILYIVSRDTIHVLAIAHQSRDPEQFYRRA